MPVVDNTSKRDIPYKANNNKTVENNPVKSPFSSTSCQEPTVHEPRNKHVSFNGSPFHYTCGCILPLLRYLRAYLSTSYTSSTHPPSTCCRVSIKKHIQTVLFYISILLYVPFSLSVCCFTTGTPLYSCDPNQHTSFFGTLQAVASFGRINSLPLPRQHKCKPSKTTWQYQNVLHITNQQVLCYSSRVWMRRFRSTGSGLPWNSVRGFSWSPEFGKVKGP